MQTDKKDNIIYFPKPMAGLENTTRFRLVHDNTETPTVHYLQAVTAPDIEMSVVEPEALDLSLEFELTEEEQALLKLEDPQDAVVAVIIYKPSADQQSEQENTMKVMIHAPIVINAKNRLAMQKRIA